jgi:hypothetical protein
MSENNHYALFGEPSVQNLEANQRGRLTPEQGAALEMAAKSQRSTFVLFGVIGLSILAFTLFIFWKIINDLGVSPERIQNLFVNVGVVAVLLGLFVAYLLRDIGVSSMFFADDDIKNGQVESVIGRVVFTGGRYKFISDIRKLQYLRFGRALPPPGDYRFYCLPKSGLVVVAEELGLVSVKQADDLLLDALARANHFSMEDLETNRQGLLSWGQEIRLFRYAATLGLFLMIFIWISFFASQNQTAKDNSLVIVFLVVMLVVMLLRLGWGSVKVLFDIWSGKVEFMDGGVTRHIRRGRNMRYYFYQLDGVKFIVSKSAYNALIEGRDYRIYFGPRSKRLVAIEPM